MSAATSSESGRLLADLQFTICQFDSAAAQPFALTFNYYAVPNFGNLHPRVRQSSNQHGSAINGVNCFEILRRIKIANDSRLRFGSLQ
jgi:hypothetical protein